MLTIFYIEYKNINYNNQIIRNKYKELEKLNIKAYKEIDSLSTINKEILEKRKEMEKKIDHLMDGVAHKELELKKIKGRYKNLANDSLIKSLEHAYKMDSISHTNK